MGVADLAVTLLVFIVLDLEVSSAPDDMELKSPSIVEVFSPPERTSALSGDRPDYPATLPILLSLEFGLFLSETS